MPFAPELRTHSQHVCTLYKRCLRMIEAYYSKRMNLRYHSVLLRAAFDKHRCECDPLEQRRLLRIGQYKLFLKTHPIPVAKFARSPPGVAGGVAYGRDLVSPDWVLDYYHPLEKAMYPQYFSTREKRKCEYVEHWKKGTLY